MLSKGFISVFRNYKEIQLGRTESLFLSVISFEPISAYGISILLKRANGNSGLNSPYINLQEGIMTTDVSPMAYKNVHKRIKRLSTLKLIEKIEGNFKRNAIMYKLTSRGIFQRLLDLYPLTPDIINIYKNDPIIETLIYQYFELETIKKFETIPMSMLRRYLRRCCGAILNTLNSFHYEERFIEKSRTPKFEIMLREHKKLLPTYIEGTIEYEAKNFIFELVNISKDEDPYQDNQSTIFPRQALLKDKKFTRFLQEIKDDFEKGLRNYI
jgi:hypothetical protein